MPLPLDVDQEIPDYQKALIAWLEEYRYTDGLQDVIRRYKFSRDEVELMQNNMSKYLKPKTEITRRKMSYA